MDLITQGLLGAAIAQAGWRKNLGRGAIVAGTLFGLMPDFDVISNIWGTWSGMVHHRGFTHSIFFAPLMAPGMGLLCWKLSKEHGSKFQWMHLIFWALLTHPLLDVFTSYGTQLLAPLDRTRFALDGVSIVDPMYTLPLLVALILAWRWRARPERGQHAARLALLFTTLYLLAGFLLARDTRHIAIAQLETMDLPPMERVRATPTFANLLAWRVVAKDEQKNIHVGFISRVTPTEIPFETLSYRDSPLIAKAMEDERAQIFYWFADDYIHWRVEEDGEQTHLFMDDMRYGSMVKPTMAMWSARVSFDEAGEVATVARTQKRPSDIGEQLSELWRLIREGTSPRKP